MQYSMEEKNARSRLLVDLGKPVSLKPANERKKIRETILKERGEAFKILAEY